MHRILVAAALLAFSVGTPIAAFAQATSSAATRADAREEERRQPVRWISFRFTGVSSSK